MTDSLRSRKGAKRRSEVPGRVLSALEAGELPTVNLVEFLAIDLARLAAATLPGVGLKDRAEKVVRVAEEICTAGVMTRMETIGKTLGEVILGAKDEKKVMRALIDHPSDVVRGFGAYTFLARTDLSVDRLLDGLRPFAADVHFGVREFAWGAGRRAVIAELDRAIAHLAPWALDPDPNIRRFASEITRPRGVWCPHIRALRDDPKPGLAILDPLFADPEKYVQDSVANWLNDAAKSRPEFTRAVVARWQKKSKSAATERIAKRALRSLD